MRLTRSLLSITFASLVVFSALGSNLGCGGGSQPTAMNATGTKSTGRMRLVIDWPARTDTRLIPTLTENITILVYAGDPAVVVGRAIASRPATGTQSVSDFIDLPAGEVRIEVNAAPKTNATSNNLLAIGSTIANVIAGEMTEANIVMNSTIARLVVSPEHSQLRVAINYPQSLRVENAAGEIVLTLPENIIRQSDNEAVVTIDSTGTLIPRSPGTARITIRETESGVQNSYNVEVLPADPTNQIAPIYEITDLRLPTQFSAIGEAVSINDNGQVVGWILDRTSSTSDARRAFLWQNGSYTMLGVPEGQEYSVALDINNKGQIVGGGRSLGPDVSVGWIWEDGAFTRIAIPNVLHPLPYVHVHSINEAGEVAGYAKELAFFRRSVNGEVTTKLTYGNSSDNNVRFADINESGDVAYSSGSNGAMSPTIWRRNGETISLQQTYFGGAATAITDDGSTVGFSRYPGSYGYGATLWAPGSNGLPLLPEVTTDFTVATDANNGKLVVGYRRFGGTSIPFIVKPGQPAVSLNDRIPANSGWVLLHANGINQKGQIVGIGLRFGQYRGFVLSPKF